MDLVKKVKERNCLERFRQAYPGFPQGPIEDSERPDFLVRSPGRTVGIDVVDYVRGQGPKDGSPELRLEKLGERIAAEAGRAWAERRGDPVDIWFFFRPDALPDKASVRALVSSLVEFVSSNTPPANSGAVEFHDTQLAGGTLEGVVDRVRILRRPGAESSLWMYTPKASFISVAQEEIQRLIDNKSGLVDAYLRKCHSVWLLIVAYWGSSLARSGRPFDDAQDHTFHSRFERVFFFNMENGSVLDLKQQE